MVMDPLLFQGQSLDLQLCALGLLHGLELMGCRHRTSEGGRLGQVTERSTCTKNKKKRKRKEEEQVGIQKENGEIEEAKGHQGQSSSSYSKRLFIALWSF